MPPTYEALAHALRAFDGGVPAHTLRQDLIYELYRTGFLQLDSTDRLVLSEKGKEAVAQLRAGVRARELSGE
jgi:hypothetical protein